MTGQITHTGIDLKNISVVLQRPKFPENIGAAARSIRNMGIHKLIVVEPDNFDLAKISKMATHFAKDIVENIQLFDKIEDALAEFNYVVGTTARLGKKREDIETPSQLAKRLIPMSCNNKIALLFGPEDKGLCNDDIKYCNCLINIPTAEFSSINLAQAVMIVCYEIFTAGGKKDEDPIEYNPTLANTKEFEGMYEHLKKVLLDIGFIYPENPDYWMNRFRRFFYRVQVRSKEIKLIRGMCKQIERYGQQRYNEGLQQKAYCPTNNKEQ